MSDDSFFSDLPRWQRPFAWIVAVAYGAVGLGIVALIVLGTVAAIFGWAGDSEGEPVATQPNSTFGAAATATTEARQPTTSPPTTDPTVGRPVYAEFYVLMLYNAGLAASCADDFGGDVPACYDAYARATEDFEAKVTAALDSYVSAAGRGIYAANQYGCHSDGRCLDDYDEWCWESELVYYDGIGAVCPGTAEYIDDERAQDLYFDQMEEERYDP